MTGDAGGGKVGVLTMGVERICWRTVVGFRSEIRAGVEVFTEARLSCGHWSKYQRPVTQNPVGKRRHCETCAGRPRTQGGAEQEAARAAERRRRIRGALDRAAGDPVVLEALSSFLDAALQSLALPPLPWDPVPRRTRLRDEMHRLANHAGLFVSPSEDLE